MTANRNCPCTSGRLYRECCAPYHRGAEPPDADALVRSRFSAFALHDDDYLWRTLHPDHEDRSRPRELYRRAVRSSPVRYMGLSLLDRAPLGEASPAQVLFLATVFERGKDRSFIELSDFLYSYDGEGLRYLSGVTLPKSAVRGDPERLTISSFQALAAR
jgi:SEC-C motif-containing protein